MAVSSTESKRIKSECPIPYQSIERMVREGIESRVGKRGFEFIGPAMQEAVVAHIAMSVMKMAMSDASFPVRDIFAIHAACRHAAKIDVNDEDLV